MDPILVGYTNSTNEADAGNPGQREPVQLTADDLITHIHGVGATRSGKSKWIEWFCRGLIRQQIGFTLIDPQGALAEDILTFLAYYIPYQPVILFDPHRTDYLVPYNPFRSTLASYDEATQQVVLSTLVSRCVETILRVWGVENTTETPRLGRWLRCVTYLLARGIITLNEAHDLLIWDHRALRDRVIAQLDDAPQVQNEWKQLQSYKRSQDFDGQIESVRNRLFDFAFPPQIRRIMSLDDRSLDFRTVFEENAIVIANLKDSDFCSQDNGRIIGTSMINDLWGAARRYGNNTRQPYFLIVDEVENFVTPDLKHILDRGAGKGLRLALFHQHLTQLKAQDQWTYDSVMGNAKLKLVFGGLTKENALIMVDNMFVNQIDYAETKIMVEQTKFWPVYDRDHVYTKSRGGATSTMDGSAFGSGAAASSGMAWQSDGMALDSTRFSHGSVASDYRSHSSASSETEAWSDGEADVPIYRPEPFKEPSSITPFTLEEQKNRLADRLMDQYQRHYFIKRPGKPTIPAATPFVKAYRVFPETEEAYIRNDLITPYAMPVEEIDQRLHEQRELLLYGITPKAGEGFEAGTGEPDEEEFNWRTPSA